MDVGGVEDGGWKSGISVRPDLISQCSFPLRQPVRREECKCPNPTMPAHVRCLGRSRSPTAPFVLMCDDDLPVCVLLLFLVRVYRSVLDFDVVFCVPAGQLSAPLLSPPEIQASRPMRHQLFTVTPVSLQPPEHALVLSPPSFAPPSTHLSS